MPFRRAEGACGRRVWYNARDAKISEVNVQVKVYATLRPIVGGAVVPLKRTGPGSTVRELVAEMVSSWPDLRPEMVDEQGNLLQRIQIMVNGRNIHYLQGLDTVLAETSSVAVFPPVGGG